MLSTDFTNPSTLIALLVAMNILLFTLFIGLGRALIGPKLEDRFSSLLLLGSGGVATIMLLARLLQIPALYDVALVQALLAVVVTVALTRKKARDE